MADNLFDDPKGIGHNSHLEAHPDSQATTAAQLASYLDRIENLEEEKREVADQIKEVRAEAKAHGYDMTALNEMLKLRKLKPDVRNEREAIRTLYGETLGIFS